jgi:hypothetical protein
VLGGRKQRPTGTRCRPREAPFVAYTQIGEEPFFGAKGWGVRTLQADGPPGMEDLPHDPGIGVALELSHVQSGSRAIPASTAVSMVEMVRSVRVDQRVPPWKQCKRKLPSNSLR